jgi:predicted metal-dependent hydrolase
MDGRVTLSVPPGISLGTAEAFLKRKAGWVRGHLAAHPPAERPELGTLVPVEGRVRRIAAVQGRPRLVGDALEVNPSREVAPQVAAVLKALARG